jgi:hypothetical protein
MREFAKIKKSSYDSKRKLTKGLIMKDSTEEANININLDEKALLRMF